MSNHSVSAMTGLKAPVRRSKGVAKVADVKVSDLANALEAGQAVLDATARLANALGSAGLIAAKAPALAKTTAVKSSPRTPPKPSPKAQGVISAKGWHPAKVTDAPKTFQGKGGTV